MLTLKSTLIGIVVLIGLLGALSLTSTATLGDCRSSPCTPLQGLLQTCCERYTSNGMLSSDAIASSGVKLNP